MQFKLQFYLMIDHSIWLSLVNARRRAQHTTNVYIHHIQQILRAKFYRTFGTRKIYISVIKIHIVRFEQRETERIDRR